MGSDGSELGVQCTLSPENQVMATRSEIVFHLDVSSEETFELWLLGHRVYFLSILFLALLMGLGIWDLVKLWPSGTAHSSSVLSA